MTQKDYLTQVILEKISVINKSDTEEALLSMIAEKIVEKSKVNTLLKKHGVLAYNIVEGNEEKHLNGVFVYCNNSLLNWTFDKCDTIADAVRIAVKKINAYILLNGEVIKYDALDDETAYYLDKDSNMKIVEL